MLPLNIQHLSPCRDSPSLSPHPRVAPPPPLPPPNTLKTLAQERAFPHRMNKSPSWAMFHPCPVSPILSSPRPSSPARSPIFRLLIPLPRSPIFLTLAQPHSRSCTQHLRSHHAHAHARHTLDDMPDAHAHPQRGLGRVRGFNTSVSSVSRVQHALQGFTGMRSRAQQPCVRVRRLNTCAFVFEGSTHACRGFNIQHSTCTRIHMCTLDTDMDTFKGSTHIRGLNRVNTRVSRALSSVPLPRLKCEMEGAFSCRVMCAHKVCNCKFLLTHPRRSPDASTAMPTQNASIPTPTRDMVT